MEEEDAERMPTAIAKQLFFMLMHADGPGYGCVCARVTAILAESLLTLRPTLTPRVGKSSISLQPSLDMFDSGE